MKRFVLLLAVVGALFVTAQPATAADPPRGSYKAGLRIANRIAQHNADRLTAYHEFLYAERFENRTVYRYYLRWRSGDDYCVFREDPSVAVYYSGPVRRYFHYFICVPSLDAVNGDPR